MYIKTNGVGCLVVRREIKGGAFGSNGVRKVILTFVFRFGGYFPCGFKF